MEETEETEEMEVPQRMQFAQNLEKVLCEYKTLLQAKSDIEERMKELEKDYLRNLIKECDHTRMVCDNCWQVAGFFKNASEHLYNGNFICKRRTICYEMERAAKEQVQQAEQAEQVENVKVVEDAGSESSKNQILRCDCSDCEEFETNK